MKKHLILLSVICLTIVTGCKEYCPAFSPDETDYLPVDFVGQTLRYVFDGDTIGLNVLPPTLEEKHERNVGLEEICNPMAHMVLRVDSETSLQYQKNYSAENPDYWDIHVGYVCNSILVWHTDYRLSDRHDILPEWTSPNGETYTNVWRYMGDRGVRGFDTSYFSPRYGLLFYHFAEHQALLLP